MKKFVSIVMVLALVLCCFVGCGEEKAEEYVIGMSGPLTGGASVYGVAVQQSAQMAVDEINAAGGLNGVNFKLIATDDMHDATKVATNYAYLLENGMQVSLGTVTTAPGEEWKNLSKDDNVFFLTPSASGDKIPEFDNGYQMCFADGNQGGVAADYVNKTYAGQTIGVFYKAGDQYSEGIYNQFKNALDATVTTVVTSFTEQTSTDFSAQIEQLKDCKFIFMPIYYTPAQLFMIQAKDKIAPDAIYYGCDGLDGVASEDFFKKNTIPQEVSMLSHFNANATEGPAKEYIDKYTAKFGAETLNQFGASAYDCVYAIYNAMKAAGDEVSPDMDASELCEVLKAQFQGGFTYENGATGEKITWDKTGYVNKGAVKYVVKAADGAAENVIVDDEA